MSKRVVLALNSTMYMTSVKTLLDMSDCAGVALLANIQEFFGEVIYLASIGDGWTGMFESEEQRITHLSAIANAILMKMKG